MNMGMDRHGHGRYILPHVDMEMCKLNHSQPLNRVAKNPMLSNEMIWSGSDEYDKYY